LIRKWPSLTTKNAKTILYRRKRFIGLVTEMSEEKKFYRHFWDIQVNALLIASITFPYKNVRE